MKRLLYGMFRRLRNDTILCIFLGCLIVVVGAVFVIFLLDINNIPTINGWIGSEDSKSWLGYLIGYAGAVVGAFLGSIATLWAVRLTIESQERARREDNAKKALPLAKVKVKNGLGETDLNISISRTIDEMGEDKYTKGFSNGRPGLSIKNVGEREMYGLQVIPVKNEFFNGPIEESEMVPILYRDEEIVLGIKVRASGRQLTEHEVNFDSIFLSVPIDLRIMFSDCYGNKYVQVVTIELSYDPNNSKDKDYIFNMSEVENCSFISAPRLLKK